MENVALLKKIKEILKQNELHRWRVSMKPHSEHVLLVLFYQDYDLGFYEWEVDELKDALGVGSYGRFFVLDDEELPLRTPRVALQFFADDTALEVNNLY